MIDLIRQTQLFAALSMTIFVSIGPAFAAPPSSTPRSADADQCDSWQNNYSVLKKYFAESDRQAWTKENLSETQVLLFGEHHLHELTPFYTWMFENIRAIDSTYDCAVFEVDKGTPIESVQANFRDWANTAKRLGLKPFFVDQHIANPEWVLSWEDRESLRAKDPDKYAAYMIKYSTWIGAEAYPRNERIAANIHELFLSGQCHRAIGIFGGFHLEDNDDNVSTKTVPQRLAELNIKSKSYDILESLTMLADTELGDPSTLDQNLTKARTQLQRCARPSQELWRKILLTKGVPANAFSGAVIAPFEGKTDVGTYGRPASARPR